MLKNFDQFNSTVPKRRPKGKYGEITLQPLLSIFDYGLIPEAETHISESPKTFEELNLNYGYVLYETEIDGNVVLSPSDSSKQLANASQMTNSLPSPNTAQQTNAPQSPNTSQLNNALRSPNTSQLTGSSQSVNTLQRNNASQLTDALQSPNALLSVNKSQLTDPSKSSKKTQSTTTLQAVRLSANGVRDRANLYINQVNCYINFEASFQF